MRWKSRQLLVFFLIVLAVMVGAFLMNTVTRPQAKPRIGDAMDQPVPILPFVIKPERLFCRPGWLYTKRMNL